MTPSGPRQHDGAEDGDDVARLIAQAGPRQAPRAAAEGTVRAVIEQEWSAQIARRGRRRVRHLQLVAAVVAVTIGAGWIALRYETAANRATVGAFVAARGPVRVEPVAGRGIIVDGDPLATGMVVRTGPSGMALIRVAGAAIRIGPSTALSLERPGRVRLLGGQVYVDTGPSAARVGSLTVATPLGDLTHLGTQFQVRLDPGPSMSVNVREGLVRMEGLGLAQTLGRREGVDVTPGGAVTHRIVEPYDALWSWVNAFVPNFPIEGQPLSVFLDWFVRETGRSLVFVPPVTRADTDQTTLSGSISGLTPGQALAAVLATTRFRYDVTVSGELRIGLNATADNGRRTNAISGAPPAVP